MQTDILSFLLSYTLAYALLKHCNFLSGSITSSVTVQSPDLNSIEQASGRKTHKQTATEGGINKASQGRKLSI